VPSGVSRANSFLRVASDIDVNASLSLSSSLAQGPVRNQTSSIDLTANDDNSRASMHHTNESKSRSTSKLSSNSSNSMSAGGRAKGNNSGSKGNSGASKGFIFKRSDASRDGFESLVLCCHTHSIS
jgi:hypothetical protein